MREDSAYEPSPAILPDLDLEGRGEQRSRIVASIGLVVVLLAIVAVVLVWRPEPSPEPGAGEAEVAADALAPLEPLVIEAVEAPAATEVTPSPAPLSTPAPVRAEPTPAPVVVAAPDPTPTQPKEPVELVALTRQKPGRLKIKAAVPNYGWVWIDGKKRAGLHTPLFRAVELSPGSHEIRLESSTEHGRMGKVKTVVIRPDETTVLGSYNFETDSWSN